LQEIIEKATILSRSGVIQGHTLTELKNFFLVVSRLNAVRPQTIAQLYNFTSL
jgi:hypothetical protein